VTRLRELGRGERIVPGVWRLRLPLPWPGVPHCNAWAVRAGEGLVLIDCGMHDADSREQLERAMAMVGLRLADVRLLACTHAHSDHWGQAATVRELAGCEFLMHENHAHATRNAEDPGAALARRMEVGRQSGVPESALRRYAERVQALPSGVARYIEPDGPLRPGVAIDTDLGALSVHETPGHAPSHVCLYNAERRILFSGDHLLGRVSLYYDYGWSPDPVGEFLASLGVVERLDVRLCLSGHGRPFTDVAAHIAANRALVEERLQAVLRALDGGPRAAVQIAPAVQGRELDERNANWLLSETLCYLRHLEASGLVAAHREGDVDLWEQDQP
jgi:glyoxylase-like metal-dependent hydrolase (beta-lactamase superfamily II)